MPLFYFTDLQMKNQAAILFDGYCNLCSWSVQFVLKRDKDNIFKYIPLQSEEGKNIVSRLYTKPVKTDSIILVIDGAALIKSDAVLEILKFTGGIWKILRIFKIFPRSVRNAMYDLVAKYRYKIFGKRKECFIPKP